MELQSVVSPLVAALYGNLQWEVLSGRNRLSEWNAQQKSNRTWEGTMNPWEQRCALLAHERVFWRDTVGHCCHVKWVSYYIWLVTSAEESPINLRYVCVSGSPTFIPSATPLQSTMSPSFCPCVHLLVHRLSKKLTSSPACLSSRISHCPRTQAKVVFFLRMWHWPSCNLLTDALTRTRPLAFTHLLASRWVASNFLPSCSQKNSAKRHR